LLNRTSGLRPGVWLALGLALGVHAVSAATAAKPAYPSSADIAYQVVWGLISLDAEQHWRVDGQRYTLSTELKLPLGFKNRRYVSQGLITEQGLEPSSYQDLSAGDDTPSHQALFDRGAGLLRYGSPGQMRSVKLEALTQDMNVLAFQLAWWGVRSGEPGLPVTNGKGLVRYSFAEPVTTRLDFQGKDFEAQHQTGSSREGELEVWSVPAMAGLPLKVIRSQDGRQLRFIARSVHIVP
jgi:hypothetical protein